MLFVTMMSKFDQEATEFLAASGIALFRRSLQRRRLKKEHDCDLAFRT